MRVSIIYACVCSPRLLGRQRSATLRRTEVHSRVPACLCSFAVNFGRRRSHVRAEPSIADTSSEFQPVRNWQGRFRTVNFGRRRSHVRAEPSIADTSSELQPVRNWQGVTGERFRAVNFGRRRSHVRTEPSIADTSSELQPVRNCQTVEGERFEGHTFCSHSRGSGRSTAKELCSCAKILKYQLWVSRIMVKHSGRSLVVCENV